MPEDGRVPDPATRTEGEGETLDMPEGFQPFTPGQVLGERYQILEMLGRGGMGEVWQAFDLKLRVEVALKALREDFFKSERRLELLRQEVRAAREVMSPNVCRIFDLIEIDGRELVSMEYVDGATLLGVLQERGPLDLKEAQDIASQFLAGLEAIHKVGLIHRDIKPENIMLTRAGRVVVMDFGLARQDTEGGGSVSGTPAYMAPEQAAGQTLDPRADVYSAGVVLAEMVSPDGIKSFESRQSLWEGVRSEPAKLPDSPWAPVLKRAVAKDREGRFNTARTLTRALEDVTLRVEGAEDLHPYPGLASYTEEDAEYFFGREADVEQMWRKLDGPPRMLAIMGPSGAGKSSFIAAGLAANTPPGWGITRSTPGNAAISSLASVVAREMAGDPDAVELLPRFDDPDVAVQVLSHWGRENPNSLLVVDQFEELFTQNSAEDQRRFADLLVRFVLESDIHVLLSMRDDFAASCNAHESLRPIFHEMTVLDPPTGANLRRALVRPATKCGYRFENDELVEEMLTEVEGERGALPLLAFAAARLWEKRDRETGLLTRETYQNIGGVGGALARHAEATIDRIGTDRIAIVRELFRNLVTAEGTRAVREWDELLSIFSDSRSESQAAVLRALIDARLLTSYEVREEDHEPTRRVEIIHESLLANWPRLVRWQTQDADAAQVRDQLRQAARTWDEQGRSDDTLWTGSAYREFAVWREAYPGGLTDVEEAFAIAMTSLATRRRRRRRIAAVAAIVLAVAVASEFGVLWRRGILETRRAEAAKLLALAQVQLETDPTEALMYATASLELADTHGSRLFATRALWAGPPLRALDLQRSAACQFMVPTFSPDGRWLAVAGANCEYVLVYGQNDREPIILDGHAASPRGAVICGWSRDGLLVTGHQVEGRVRVWSLPEGRLVRTIEFGYPAWWQVGESHLLAEMMPAVPEGEPRILYLKRWRLPGGEAEDLGSVTWPPGASNSCFDPDGQAWIYARGDSVYARSLPVVVGAPARLIARHSSARTRVRTWGRPEGLYSADSDGQVVLWATADGTSVPGRLLRTPVTATTMLRPDLSGRWMIEDDDMASGQLGLWDLTGLRGTRARALRRSGMWRLAKTDFHPRGDWVVANTGDMSEVSFWPLSTRLPDVVDGGWNFWGFTSDGRYLMTTKDEADPDGTYRARLWPVPGAGSPEIPDLRVPTQVNGIEVDVDYEHVLTKWYGNNIFLIPLSGDEPRRLEGFAANDLVNAVFSPSGRQVVGATAFTDGQPTLRVWDLQTDEVRVFDQPKDPEAAIGTGYVQGLAFVDEDTLYTGGANGLLRWNLETGTYEMIRRGSVAMVMASEGRKILIWESREASIERTSAALLDMEKGEIQSLDIPGKGMLGLSPDGTIWVSSETDGSIWVGRIEGGEPHLLLGHEGQVWFWTAVSPDNQWIGSSALDTTLRLWPMPDLSKPPLHTLPQDELIAKLHSLTNLRVVRDEESSTGWKVEIGPFPGWAEVPEW